jgi:hypothetical protein
MKALVIGVLLIGYLSGSMVSTLAMIGHAVSHWARNESSSHDHPAPHLSHHDVLHHYDHHTHGVDTASSPHHHHFHHHAGQYHGAGPRRESGADRPDAPHAHGGVLGLLLRAHESDDDDGEHEALLMGLARIDLHLLSSARHICPPLPNHVRLGSLTETGPCSTCPRPPVPPPRI